MTLTQGFVVFVVAALAVRHAAYILMRGSIFESMRKWIGQNSVSYRFEAQRTYKNYQNYAGRRHKAKTLRRRTQVIRRRFKSMKFNFLATVYSKMDELFGCYVCMTAQLSIWLIAVPVAIVTFVRYGNPTSLMFGKQATLFATVPFTALLVLLLALAVAAIAVVWWHAIEIVQTYRSDRLNEKSDARELAMAQDTKLQNLNNLIGQLQDTIRGLEKTVKAAADATPVEAKVEKEPSHRLVETYSSRGRYIIVDANGDRVSDVLYTINEVMDAYNLFNARGYFDSYTAKSLLAQINKAFGIKTTSPTSTNTPATAPAKFSAKDAQDLVTAVGEACDHITWCAEERRDCRRLKTRRFMAQWASDRNTQPNGISDKANQMMIDYFHAKRASHNKRVDVNNIYAKHFN